MIKRGEGVSCSKTTKSLKLFDLVRGTAKEVRILTRLMSAKIEIFSNLSYIVPRIKSANPRREAVKAVTSKEEFRSRDQPVYHQATISS